MEISKRKILAGGLAGSVGLLMVSSTPVFAADQGDATDSRSLKDLLVDDFSNPPYASVGGRWSYVSDRVMGGVSNGNGGYEQIEGRQALRLLGEVSTRNNGGFIQLSLQLDGRDVGAADFKGMEVDVLGNGETYEVHVNNRGSLPPWRFYSQKFETGPKWQRIRLPWTDFTSKDFRRPLDPSRINRFSLTAYARDFAADMAISRIALYT